MGFQKFDEPAQEQLKMWLETQAQSGLLPNELFQQAERYLLTHRILLPGPSVLERLIIHACAEVHIQLFESLYEQLSPALRKAIDHILETSEGKQRSTFYQLKEYPPSATIASLKTYLKHYRTISAMGIDAFEARAIDPAFLEYLFQLANRYTATDLKRFTDHKRYTLMIGFLLEIRRMLLDHLVTMHDQYVMEMCRQSKNAHEKQYRDMRKRQKNAIDVVLEVTTTLLDWPNDEPLSRTDLWQSMGEKRLRDSLDHLRAYQRLVERGYGDLLLTRYPSLRK